MLNGSTEHLGTVTKEKNMLMVKCRPKLLQRKPSRMLILEAWSLLRQGKERRENFTLRRAMQINTVTPEDAEDAAVGAEG